jgi:hypothetical protein
MLSVHNRLAGHLPACLPQFGHQENDLFAIILIAIFVVFAHKVIRSQVPTWLLLLGACERHGLTSEVADDRNIAASYGVL